MTPPPSDPGPAADAQPDVAAEELRVRARRGWYVYDWASSAFSTTVITVFLGPYLTGVAEDAAGADGRVPVLWLDVRPGSFFAYAISLSVVLQVVVLPLVGAVADRTGRKLFLLGLFAAIGVAATLAMALVTGTAYLLGGALLVVANVAFGAGTVVYNAFLPEVALPDERDAVSSRGWALGYLGGALLLTANLVLYLFRDSLGLSAGDAARICLASAALWWGLFALVPLRRLRQVPYPSRAPTDPATRQDRGTRSLLAGFGQLRRTFAAMRELPQTLLFLAAYLFYNDGVQTVIALASVFGAEELGMSETVLIVAVLEVQLVAFGGALLLGRLAGRYGARRVIAGSLVVWIAVLLVAYRLPAGRTGLFLALAAAIGLVLGGTQALSRSLYTQVIPRSSEAEYFSFYELSERGTSWLGPLVFGIVFDVTASYRNALVVLVVFFVVGLVLLLRVRVRDAVAAAGNPQPRLV